jgi:hypothetical protein
LHSIYFPNYNLDDEAWKYAPIAVAEVKDSLVEDMLGSGKLLEDAGARGMLEEEAKIVRMPGVSKKPLGPFGVSEESNGLE